MAVRAELLDMTYALLFVALNEASAKVEQRSNASGSASRASFDSDIDIYEERINLLLVQLAELGQYRKDVDKKAALHLTATGSTILQGYMDIAYEVFGLESAQISVQAKKDKRKRSPSSSSSSSHSSSSASSSAGSSWKNVQMPVREPETTARVYILKSTSWANSFPGRATKKIRMWRNRTLYCFNDLTCNAYVINYFGSYSITILLSLCLII